MKSAFKNWMGEFKLKLAKRSLETELAGIINVMEGHKAAGLPSGHDYYKLLWNRANEKMKIFSSEYGISMEDLLVGVPALRQLGQLTVPASEKLGTKAVGIAVAVSLGLWAFVTFAALMHDWYHLIARW